ncbi:MAG: HigA family addiction module antitoxin [Deltaproteobacteria bacterium]
MSQPIRYEPDYVTRPGEVLEEYLAVSGMTKAELASRCGRPTKTISEIIHGKAAITAETAIQLGRVFGRPASLWQNLEANYRLRLAEREEHGKLAQHAVWAKKFPVKAMVDAGCMERPTDDADLVTKMLRFFGVGSVAGWESRFRDLGIAYRRSRSFMAAPEAVAAWLRRGEIHAAEVDCKPFDRDAFSSALDGARRLTRGSFPEVHSQLRQLCASGGVALVFVPELPKTHLSGAARWLTKDKALIQLSLRHKTNDHVWFSFFHEAGHILLHGKKAVFIDESGGDRTDIEDEANKFASEWLIPPGPYATFARSTFFSAALVKAFAEKQGVAPGIVVGRLQHDGLIQHSHLNALKELLAWG